MTATEWLWLCALCIFSGVYAWAAYRLRFLSVVPWGDTWVHLALTRRTLEHGWFPGDAFYAGMATPPYYSLAHVLFAAASWITGAPPHSVWLALPPVVVVMTIAGQFVWLRALTGDIRVAAIAAGTVLLVQTPDPALPVAAYPRTLALAPLMMALLCYLRGRQRRELRWLAAAGISFGLCVAVHPLEGGFCLLGLLFLELALAARVRRPSPNVLIVPILGALLSSPWLLNILRRWWERETLSPGLFNTGAVSSALALGPARFSVLRPSAVLDGVPAVLWPLLGVAFTVSLWRWSRRRSTITDRYVLIAVAGAAAFLLTPLYGLFSSAGGVWISRAPQLIPFPLLIGLGATQLVDVIMLLPRTPRQRVALAALAVLAGAGAASWAMVTARSSIAAGANAQAWFTPGPLPYELEEAVARSGSMPRVVLSDLSTSYLLPYYLGCSVVAIPDGHASAYVDPRPREEAVWRVYDPRTPMPELHAILDRYAVDTVVVAPGAFDRDLAELGRTLARRLRQQPDFEERGTWAGLVFYRYRPHHPGTASPHVSLPDAGLR